MGSISNKAFTVSEEWNQSIDHSFEYRPKSLVALEDQYIFFGCGLAFMMVSNN